VTVREPGWLGAAVAGGVGALAGVLAALALGGGESVDVRTVTVTTRQAPESALVAEAIVPAVVGARLDVARARVRRAGFVAVVEGAGILGVLHPSTFTVTGQDPRPGGAHELGKSVHLRVHER
jgi:hypothetical protein